MSVAYLASSHYLYQCWYTVNCTLGNKTKFSGNWRKIHKFYTRKLFWKYRVQNGDHFVSASVLIPISRGSDLVADCRAAQITTQAWNVFSLPAFTCGKSSHVRVTTACIVGIMFSTKSTCLGSRLHLKWKTTRGGWECGLGKKRSWVGGLIRHCCYRCPGTLAIPQWYNSVF